MKQLLSQVKFETIMLALTIAAVTITVVHMGLNINDYNQDRELVQVTIALKEMRK